MKRSTFQFSQRQQLFIVALLFLSSMLSCRKFLDIPYPKDRIIKDQVFESDKTAEAAVLGIYIGMMQNPQQFSSSYTTLYCGMSADEIEYFVSSQDYDQFKLNLIIPTNGLLEGFWASPYKYIYSANAILEGLSNSPNISTATKKRLTGEAKFIRAFCYFYLVNLFGDVPLILHTDVKISSVEPRTPTSSIYDQIILDLSDSKLLLDNVNSPEKVRPSSLSASALLARVYLYNNQWAKAVEESALIINSGQYQIAPLSETFLKNSTETIWQLMPVNTFNNTWEGYNIIPSSTDAQPEYIITTDLLNSFEPGDERKSKWLSIQNYAGTNFYYPFKYKIKFGANPLNEYYIVLRLSEIILIRAEAEANQNNILGAVNDINLIRSKSGLSDISTNISQSECLLAIENERRHELFSEWGHRWLDLKRTNRTTTVLGILKPTWTTKANLYPIPQNERSRNPNLTQNPGY